MKTSVRCRKLFMSLFYFLNIRQRIFHYSLFATVGILIFAGSNSYALNESAQTFTLDGNLYQTGSVTPLLDSSAKITVQIIDPTGKCLLYEEEQTVDTRNTDGYFNIHVGSLVGATKRTVSDPGRTMNQIFQNLSGITANSVAGQTCVGGAYSPAVGAVRYFRLIVTPSATNVADTLTPDIVMDSVPSALVAQSVQGLERSSILQVYNSGSTVLTQANLESLFTTPAYANLQSILAGNFIKTDTSGATLPTYAADPAGAANGDIWFDSVTNEIKYKNAAGVQVVGVSSGGISSLTVGSSMSINGTVAGSISGSGTIDLSNTGVTAGTYTKMTVDAKGRVTAGTVSLVEGDIPNLTAAGKVSGNTITSGTISGSAGVNTSGNLVTTGTVSGLTVQATNLRIYNGANYLQMTASTMSGNVNLTLPATAGSAGQFLSTDGNGILSWSGIASLLAGDVSGAFGATSVDKIKGRAVTAATVSGQTMIYNGTAWVNSVVSGDATLAHDGMLTLNKVPVSKGGTNATSFGNNRIIASNGTGTALIDFACSLNQVITFDVSGSAACSNASALTSGILNGGNTTAADISIGTNDNKALKLKVNNTIAMTISQNGSVGIGTAAPTGIFEVQGGTAAAGTAGALISIYAQNGAAGNYQGGDIILMPGARGGPLARSGFIGVGISTPQAYMHVRKVDAPTYSNGTVLLLDNETGSHAIRVVVGNDQSDDYSVIEFDGLAPTGTDFVLGQKNNQFIIEGATTAISISHGTGAVGVRNSDPAVALDVQGQIRSRVKDATSTTTIDWNNGNIQYTTDSCQAYTFGNLVDGGSYTFVVKGATSAQCAFTTAGLTYHFTPTNAPTNASTHSVYTLFRAGSDVYVSWTTGL